MHLPPNRGILGFVVAARDLLARGLFPRELPPCFTTETFARWQASAPPLNVPQTSELGYHDLARVGSLRRHLGIPNPFTQAKLASVVAENWANIAALFEPAPYSLTIPTSVHGPRALEPAKALSARAHERARTRASRKHLVKTDVSQFYHSIYTDALPWAIHTRPVAKQNRGKNLYGNMIDEALRNTQHGQTIGIPIGPDTSLVLAEILLARVDRDLAEAFPDVRGFRYLDDYELTTRSHSEA